MVVNKPTIRDVAKYAGVSVATVSRVLNNNNYISEETKNKVLNVINEIGYIPNQVARSLYKKESKLIGVIVPTIEIPYFAEIVYSIEKNLEALDYKILLCNSLNDIEIEKKYLDMLLKNQVEGIIVGTHNKELKEYEIANVPIVAIEIFLNKKKIPTICCDNFQGGELATNYLINLGCKNIICISGDSKKNFPADDRKKAYEQMMDLNNLNPINIEVADLDIDSRKIYLEKKLKELNQVDGIFATDDILAILINEILDNKSGKIPIVGFDGTKLIRNLFPDLVTIQQPIDSLAEASVTTLVRLINKQTVEIYQKYPVSLYTN